MDTCVRDSGFMNPCRLFDPVTLVGHRRLYRGRIRRTGWVQASLAAKDAC